MVILASVSWPDPTLKEPSTNDSDCRIKMKCNQACEERLWWRKIILMMFLRHSRAWFYYDFRWKRQESRPCSMLLSALSSDQWQHSYLGKCLIFHQKASQVPVSVPSDPRTAPGCVAENLLIAKFEAKSVAWCPVGSTATGSYFRRRLRKRWRSDNIWYDRISIWWAKTGFELAHGNAQSFCFWMSILQHWILRPV